MTETTTFKVGDKVRINPWPETYMISEIVTHIENEPIARFYQGGFWRCSGLEAA